MRKPWYDDPMWLHNNRGLIWIVGMVAATALGIGCSILLLWLGVVT